MLTYHTTNQEGCRHHKSHSDICPICSPAKKASLKGKCILIDEMSEALLMALVRKLTSLIWYLAFFP